MKMKCEGKISEELEPDHISLTIVAAVASI